MTRHHRFFTTAIVWSLVVLDTFAFVALPSKHVSCQWRDDSELSSSTPRLPLAEAWNQLWTDLTTGKRTDQEQQQQQQDPYSDSSSTATVVRLASRSYNATSSKPSSKNYTNRKNEQFSVNITKNGVEGDYNHYRTVALKSTPDRALSILTQDVMDCLQQQHPEMESGDLGENILLEGASFDYFQIGKQYHIKNVLFEITEPMIPCANLCTLPVINNENLTPKERVQKCKDFLDFMDARGDGFRGWYAKILTPGLVRVGDKCCTAKGSEQERNKRS